MTNNERIGREILGISEDWLSSPNGRERWNFEKDLWPCFDMEEAIKKKGWAKKYADKLIEVCRPGN